MASISVPGGDDGGGTPFLSLSPRLHTDTHTHTHTHAHSHNFDTSPPMCMDAFFYLNIF